MKIYKNGRLFDENIFIQNIKNEQRMKLKRIIYSIQLMDKSEIKFILSNILILRVIISVFTGFALIVVRLGSNNLLYTNIFQLTLVVDNYFFLQFIATMSKYKIQINNYYK